MKKLTVACIAALMAFSTGAEELNAAAPFFKLTMIGTDDKPLALESFKGKPLIVNFWAPWCEPCRKEIPDLAQTKNKYESKGLAIVGLTLEDAESRGKVGEFANTHGMNYTLLMAGSGEGIELMRALGNLKGGATVYGGHRQERKDRR